MAKAERATEARKRTVEEKVPVVKLTLEKEEATTLARILLNVGGPQNGRRGKASKIVDALLAAGVIASPQSGVTGSIFLDDDPFRSFTAESFLSSVVK